MTFELGGKSPNIVFADADLDAAVEGAMLGMYLNQGQCCCAGSRLFVQDTVHDEFVEKLAAQGQGPQARRPVRPRRPQMGPQVDKAQFDKILSLHRQGQGAGGDVRDRRRAARRQGLLHQADGLRRRQGRHGDRPRRDLRPGPVGASSSRTSTRSSTAPTRPTTAWPPPSGPATSARPTPSPTASVPAPSGSTATTSSTPPPPSAASRRSGIGRELGEKALDNYTELKTVTIVRLT